MSGRGRGRGRGGSNRLIPRDHLIALGVASNELLPTIVTQPPPLFPLLDHKPVPITPSLDLDYLLIVRQEFIDFMHSAPSYLEMPQNTEKQPEQEIDILLAQLPSAKTKCKFDWRLLPSELRPKLHGKKTSVKTVKEIDVNSRLNQLEKLEEKKQDDDAVEKVETESDGNVLEDGDFLEEDEEMDDGTDYANNYFDNGESYEDEDDNLDDGPIY